MKNSNAQTTSEPKFQVVINGRVIIGTKDEIQQAIADDRENR